MKLYLLCLAVAVALAVALQVFAGYTATYGTVAIESSRELSDGEMALIGSGSFIARWFVAILAVLVSGALVSALLLGRRAAHEAS